MQVITLSINTFHMQKYLLLKTLFCHPMWGKKNNIKKKSGNGTGVFLSRVQHRRAFSQFKRKRWFFGERLVSTWQLHKHHLCLSFAPHQLHHARRSARTQTQTLLRCSVNSAAPLALYTYTSCTQTFHGVNTQRSAPNAKWAARARTQAPDQPALLIWNIRFKPCLPPPSKAPVMALPVPHVRNVCATKRWDWPNAAKVPKAQNPSGHSAAPTTAT